ncbi:MAG: mechanosensitive ion channel family protein [Chloroflexota bacterium]
MVQMKWRRHSDIVLACLVILLVLASSSLAPIAVAQSEPTPDARATQEPVTTPAPTPDQSSGASVSDASNPFLSLTPEQWADVAISFLLFLVIAIFGWRFLIWLGKLISRRTNTEIDDRLLLAVRGPLQWISVIFGFQVAYSRLDFLSPSLRELVDNVSFILYTILGSMIVWVIIDSGLNIYRDIAQENDADMKSIDRLLPLVRTFARGLLVIVAIIIILHWFGVEITAVVAALGLTGFAISLAAKDTLTNIIAGLTIAVSRPFRINDRIYNKDVGGWVDVVEIGLRSTKVLTRDNRMVIIPNSDLSDDTVINYSFPNHNYRLQVDIGVAYGTDINTARQVLRDAVSQVDDVMSGKPVQVLFVEFGESSMVFRVRWWIADYADMRKVNDRVYQAIQEALDAHGIVSPGPILDVNYHLDQPDADRLAQVFQSDQSKGLASE